MTRNSDIYAFIGQIVRIVNKTTSVTDIKIRIHDKGEITGVMISDGIESEFSFEKELLEKPSSEVMGIANDIATGISHEIILVKNLKTNT